MTDEVTGNEAEEVTEKQYSESEYNDLKSQLERVLAKNDELLTESKRAKESRRQAEEEARKVAEEKAKKDGDFEHLFKSSQEKLTQLQQELETERQQKSREKCETKALEIANKIANGPNEALLLAEHVKRRLKYDGDGFTVLDGSGNPSVMKMDDLLAEFKGNELYSSLLKGNQSTGGGAPGGQGSGAAKTVSRAEFDKMSPKAKMDFVKSGGKTTD